MDLSNADPGIAEVLAAEELRDSGSSGRLQLRRRPGGSWREW